MSVTTRESLDASIIIPVFNKLAFTRQCLDRIWRNTSEELAYEIIVVDNGSTDSTEEYFSRAEAFRRPVHYHRNPTNLGFAKANNIGARLSRAKYLMFLNNDTLVQPRWLEEMVALAESDPAIGIVGIKQLFPYTNRIHHTGIIFTAGRVLQHLYPHADATLPHVNKQREYQAVTGSCLLIGRELFGKCGGFDENYLNGYEDVDLCMAVRRLGLKVMCCTTAYIYHYGQITEGRTADDDKNAAYFASKWASDVRVDERDYLRQDLRDVQRAKSTTRPHQAVKMAENAFYFADDLSQGSALAWAVADLVLALKRIGMPVFLRQGALTDTLPSSLRRELEAMMVSHPNPGGIHLKWSHFWPRHLSLDLSGTINLEFFVINYIFGQPGTQPWDYWLQCLRQNHYHKLPLSEFCKQVLLQVGVPEPQCDVFPLGYSREIHEVAPPARASDRFRFLTVTNSHDLERYGTGLLLEAYWEAFDAKDDVVLVVKDYGSTLADTTLRELITGASERAKVEYVTTFVSKKELIQLYRSCDAFVSAHRGEGFGMKILDALACGLPVITPLFGGPKDYCTPTNSFPVDFALVPMGDCLDSRELRITNQPMWCEPNLDDLVKKLRFVFENPNTTKAVGEQGRRDVVDRFTWENAATRLVQIVETIRASQPKTLASAALQASSTHGETSPYWLGCRISVVIPTYNRKDLLLNCLQALANQSILPQEFEIVVIDDGSTDGTEAALAGRTFPFPLQYYRQTNQGQGAARNLGILKAQGELILFIGDDIIADERLLENHLLMHAEHPHATAAVLGHIDWPPWLTPSSVMEYVCGEGTHQFGYRYIPFLPSLDYRFFYTSNISLKRSFLVEALKAGVRFDPCFQTYGFEDSEFGYRLQTRGLELHYCKEALAYHDHWMDFDSFSTREYKVGQMAVVFYRKHPQLDEILQVRWIGDWVDAVERLVTQPSLLEKVKAIDAQTDKFLAGLERSLEELLHLETALGRSGNALAQPRDGVQAVLHSILGLMFDVQRTRGKVQEWFAAVEDKEKVEAAKSLLGCLRKLEFFAPNAKIIQDVPGTIPSAGTPTPVPSLLRRTVLRGPLFSALRTADLALQGRLSKAANPRWLARYQRWRTRLKRIL